MLDRSGLILDIFAQRARTFEGKLQVELAQLEHLSTRLVRGWTHLERQKGGIGLRGPGETQLETDRRLVARRIKTLNDRLDKVLVQRETTRRERTPAAPVPTVALVGYTNAGKSTLFNRLTAPMRTRPTSSSRRWTRPCAGCELAPGLEMALADTVGFVRDLPHELVAAFRSTLQEAREADLLLHVIDAADPARSERIAQVNEVLASIGAREVPQIAVYNKIDRTGESRAFRVRRRGTYRPGLAVGRTAVSGIDLLLRGTARVDLGSELCHCVLRMPRSRGPGARAAVHDAGAVLSSERVDEDGGSRSKSACAARDLERICREDAVSIPPAVRALCRRRRLPTIPGLRDCRRGLTTADLP